MDAKLKRVTLQEERPFNGRFFSVCAREWGRGREIVPVILGLTGGIASGKSFVADELARRGAVLVDADVVSRQTTAPGSPVLKQLARAFGSDVLRPDGSLDRGLLGTRVFGNPERLAELNSLTHPLIWKEIHHQLGELSMSHPLVVLVAPLLLEHGGERFVDRVWVVHVRPEVQLERLMRRDGLSLEQAEARRQAQMDESERLAKAHVVIDNSGSPEETLEQLDRAWSRVESEAKGDERG